jgi:hypothetical protein
MEVVDGLRGEVRSVDVLGASNYAEARACRTGSPRTFGAFAYFGATGRQTVSDNLKAGTTRAWDGGLSRSERMRTDAAASHPSVADGLQRGGTMVDVLNGAERTASQAAFLSLRMMMKSSEGGGGNA